MFNHRHLWSFLNWRTCQVLALQRWLACPCFCPLHWFDEKRFIKTLRRVELFNDNKSVEEIDTFNVRYMTKGYNKSHNVSNSFILPVLCLINELSSTHHKFLMCQWQVTGKTKYINTDCAVTRWLWWNWCSYWLLWTFCLQVCLYIEYRIFYLLFSIESSV